jgi:hypothetical protein
LGFLPMLFPQTPQPTPTQLWCDFQFVHYAKDICRDRSELTSSLDHVRTDQALGNLP